MADQRVGAGRRGENIITLAAYSMRTLQFGIAEAKTHL